MATIQNVLDGLRVLCEHGQANSHYVQAEHDEIWAGNIPPNKMTPGQLAKMEEAGWKWKSDVDSWHRFV